MPPARARRALGSRGDDCARDAGDLTADSKFLAFHRYAHLHRRSAVAAAV
jgi:hypothetical protein